MQPLSGLTKWSFAPTAQNSNLCAAKTQPNLIELNGFMREKNLKREAVK